MPDITIVMKPRDVNDLAKGMKLEPATGRRTQVKSGELVTFRIGPNVQALQIQFSGPSPFGEGHETVLYGQPLAVAVSFDTADPQRNLFVYSCISTNASSDDGGEMEVIRT